MSKIKVLQSLKKYNNFNIFQVILLFFGAVLAFFHQITEVSFTVDMVFFTALLLFLGIPHGAVDHIISRKTKEKEASTFSLVEFFGKYLAQMLLYALLWFLAPTLSLLFFLALSVWHFGESDAQPSPRTLLWRIVQLTVGSLVLFYIFMREPNFTADLMYRITQNNENILIGWNFLARNSIWVYGILFSSLILSYVLAQSQEKVRVSVSKIVTYLGLLLIIYFLPLLPAFVLYFSAWHALNTFKHMADFMGADTSIYQLWLKALPFTIISFVFLVVVGFVWFTMLSEIDPLPVLFIFIAIITLPHLVVMHGMFRHSNKVSSQ